MSGGQCGNLGRSERRCLCLRDALRFEKLRLLFRYNRLAWTEINRVVEELQHAVLAIKADESADSVYWTTDSSIEIPKSQMSVLDRLQDCVPRLETCMLRSGKFV